jgi:hypothetical protein
METFEALSIVVYMYGIVRVSKSIVTFVAFAVNAPETYKFEETFRVVTLAREATRFVVVTVFETTRFENG